MNLWSITVMLKTPNSGTRLLFADYDRALAAQRNLTRPEVIPEGANITVDGLPPSRREVTDDFGNTYTVVFPDIASVLLTDMAAECEGMKEMEMLQAHMKADLYERMSKDDKVKAMQRAMNPTLAPSSQILGGFRQ